MNNSPEKYFERMIELGRKKYGYLQDILALTQKQTAVIVEDGIEVLGQLINEKQKVIEEIDRLDEEYGVYFQRLKTVLKITDLADVDASKTEGAKKLKDVTSGLMELIKQIKELETSNNEKAHKLYNHFGEEIRKISAGKKMTSAYAPKGENPPSFYIDKKK